MQGYDDFFKKARKAKQSFPVSPTRTNDRPEARLKSMVESRVKAKRAQAMRRRQRLPVGALLAVSTGLAIAGTGYFMPDSVDWLLQNIEVGAFGEASASADKKAPGGDAEGSGESATGKKSGKKTESSSDKEKAADSSAHGEEKTAGTSDTTKVEKAAEGMPDTHRWSQEEISFFNKLSERKRELDLREAELNKLEEELQRQKVELEERLKKLEAMRSQIAQTLKARVDNDQTKVTKLVEVYSGMKPQQAAKVLETINEDLAIQVLDQMKKKSAADILNVMDAKKAQRLSEMLAGYKRPE